ncbi:hypothetical protein B0H13DRAFT_2341363 [Mycena leptocephala]|nr:hypothetical protein B0H13DRAFT_2341363 [Mycena leptocephala]
MSSFNILGFFQLKAGRRVTVNKPNSTYATHYAHYNTHVCTTPLLTDGMVVFAACSAQSTAVEPATNSLPTNTLTLDAMTFFVLPGSPDSDTYNPNNAIQSYGVCRELSPTGILLLKVDSTALNISSNALAPSDDISGSAGSTASAPVTPSKRRKFDPTSPPPSVDSRDSPFASSTSTLSANVTTSMVSVPHPNARIGPMHYSQLFQQCPQYMPQPTGAFLPPFLPPQGLYSMPGYLTFQSPYAPYNSLGEYTLPPSVDSRASTSTRDSGSTDISSAFVASPLTVPLSHDTNPSRDEFINRKYFAIQHANFGPTFVFVSTGPRRS